METNIASGTCGNLCLQGMVLLLINNYYKMVCTKEVPLLFLAWRTKVKASKSGFINKIMVKSLGFLCLSFFLLSFFGCWPLASKGHTQYKGVMT